MDPIATPERLSPLDASFLYLERPTESLHVGAVAVLAGTPATAELLAMLEQRLGGLHRYRQVPRRPFLDWHLPEWHDAPDFDVRRHLHRHVLTAPGDETQLHATVDAVFASPLSDDQPLWECHVIEGLAGGRAALVLKIHHCMIDGVSGVQVLDALTRTEMPIPPECAAPPASGGGWIAAVVDACAHPVRTLARARRTVAAGGTLAGLALDAAPAFPWNGPIGAARAVRWHSFALDRLLAVRGAGECKVNDVALAVIAGALRRLFAPAAGARALVPVSLRRPDEHLTLGNRISGHLVTLPLDVDDPRERLRRIAAEMRAQKSPDHVPAFDVAVAMASVLPASVAPLLVHLNDHRPFVHTVCTNVPGPSEPRLLAGARVLEIHPIVPLAAGVGLGFAMLSYAGTFSIAATADPALVPAIDLLPAALAAAEAELAECLGIAGAPRAQADGGAPTVGDIMSRTTATTTPATRLGEIWALMRTRRIRHVPVVDGAGCLRGLVTHRDVLAAFPSSLGTEGRTANLLAFDWAEARDVMETHLSTATPGEPARAAGRRMADQKIGCLPVVGARGELVGIVTETDFLRWATDHMAA